MSVGKKLEGLSAGLGAMLDSKKTQAPSASKAAPAQLLTFREEMNKYEDRIADLERQLKDSARSEIPVGSIIPNPWQPRIEFNEAAIKELADSIAETGLIQPILVKSVTSRDTFQLIAGERRWRAHQLLSKETIKAIIVEVSDSDAAVMALAENIEREDLADYEIACAIRRMEKEFPNRKRLAEAIGIARQDLYKYLAFDKLPAAIKVDLAKNPKLLGRNAAEQVASALKAGGLAATAKLEILWPKVIEGSLDQMKLADAIQGAIGQKGESQMTSAKENLVQNGVVFGSFSRSKSGLAINLKGQHLTAEKESRLFEFLKKLIDQ